MYQIFAPRAICGFSIISTWKLYNLWLFWKQTPPPSYPIAMALHHQVDVDHSGSLNLREFILCMRKVREVELKAVKILGLFCGGGPRDQKIRRFLMGISYEILRSSYGSYRIFEVAYWRIRCFSIKTYRTGWFQVFSVKMIIYGCFLKWVGFPQSPHLKSWSIFRKEKHPMEIVGETSPPFVGNHPPIWHEASHGCGRCWW